MTSMPDPGYFIADPRPIEADAPYTFFIASEAEVAAVSEGDLVQLTFELDPPGAHWSAERMWVTVTGADGDRLTGRLESNPDDAPLKKGAEVRFRRLDILHVYFADASRAPPPDTRREYWYRCLVESCVIEGDEPVEYIYREAPDLGEATDKHPDSGWRIRGRRGAATAEAYDGREVRYVALGLVLNRDDSWLPLIGAPVGSAFTRNFETGEYEPSRIDEID
jgi:hypothetical protein